MENEGQETIESVRIRSQKRNRKMNENNEMEWKERIGMEMDKSECDGSV